MSHPRLIIISAMTRDRVIGTDDGMPWDVPDEFQHFLDTVRDQTVLFGRRSYEMFKGGLTADRRVVLSNSQDKIDGAVVCRSLEEGLETARGFGEPVFCCGGASVYEQAVPHADEMHLSTIKGDYQGNAWFPEFDQSEWRVVEEVDHGEWVFRKWQRH
jgi:dihydrofolate reductase